MIKRVLFAFMVPMLISSVFVSCEADSEVDNYVYDGSGYQKPSVDDGDDDDDDDGDITPDDGENNGDENGGSSNTGGDVDPSSFANIVELKDDKVTVSSYSDTYVDLDATWLTIKTASISQIKNSAINIKNADARIFLPDMLSDDWDTSGLKDIIYVDGYKIDIGVNAELKPYYDYIYIRLISDDWEPAVLYAGEESAAVEHSTIYTGSDVPLGTSVDKILLKRGHQIVVAASEDGTKSSRCFIAMEKDLEIVLDGTLSGQVKFLRTLAVDFINKRGVAAKSLLTSKYYPPFDFAWFYNWTATNSGEANEPFTNFLAMCNGSGSITDSNFQTIIDKEYPLVMAFNEPDNKDQANLSVAEAIALYKEMHKLGVRLGSPSTEQVTWTNDSAWINLFMDEVEAQGLRVDVMGHHWYDVGYQGNLTPATSASGSPGRLTTNLKQCYERHGLPIIITEFNNGSYDAGKNKGYVPWECCVKFLPVVVPQLEALDYVERYALFPPNGGTASTGETISNGIKAMMLGENGKWVYLTTYGESYLCCDSTPSITIADDAR